MRWTRWWMVAGLACMGCTGALKATPPPDEPIPAGEPTEAVTLAVELPRSQDCEEAFDLAMYENRGVHLIEWDGSTGRCTGRTVRVVYLPRRITRDGVMAEARKRVVKLSAAADR